VKHLDEAKKSGIKKGAVTGLTMGTVWCLIYCSYALGIYISLVINLLFIEYLLFVTTGFWYGAKLIRDEGYNVGGVIIVS
jgi:hypothetical protein